MDDRQKLIEKIKKDPMVPLGMAGFVGIVTYAIVNFKRRGNKPVSIYLIHTRLAAQGAVIGSITLGMIYSIYSKISKRYAKAEAVGSSSS